MPIPVSDDFILYPSQQPPAPPESPQSGFSCIWTRRSVLDSSSPQPQPQPQPDLPELSQSGFSWIWRRISTSRSKLDSSSWQPPPPVGSKLFTYGELKSATNGFSESNLMGEGGFGCVYRGFLRDYGIVAIKKHNPKTSQGAAEFRAEVHIASRLYHRHIVSLVGYYFDHQVKARLERPLMLVYEFLPNNSLQFHLYGRGTETIDWKTRMKIAVGSAKGLTYLHEGCKPKIIHRDIKPSNLLLDENFQPKIADFGLASFIKPDNETCISMSRVMETDGLAELSPDYEMTTSCVKGTWGYVAPEYSSFGRFSEKSDVYSFGVVLFELITGRKRLNDPAKYPGGRWLQWAIPLFSVALQNRNFEEVADARLGNEYNAEEMFRMVSCAANCVRFSAAHRPRMSQVVQALEGVSRLDNEDLTNGYYEYEETTEGTYGSVVNPDRHET